MEGVKHDGGKLPLNLLPVVSLEELAKVLQYGAAKYGENNWQGLDNAQDRYYAALLRHLFAWQRGENNDPESGLPHIAHAACNAIFLVWFEIEKISSANS